jgi:hypothetical protein
MSEIIKRILHLLPNRSFTVLLIYINISRGFGFKTPEERFSPSVMDGIRYAVSGLGRPDKVPAFLDVVWDIPCTSGSINSYVRRVVIPKYTKV